MNENSQSREQSNSQIEVQQVDVQAEEKERLSLNPEHRDSYRKSGVFKNKSMPFRIAQSEYRKALPENRASWIQKYPMKLTFKDINYEVTVKRNKKNEKMHIVKNATGYALPGQTLYIMGASGAGKSSLLNILSDRVSLKKGDKLTGSIMINDTIKLDKDVFGKNAAYVMQDDVIFSYFTPREALTFAARLKLDCSKEKQDIKVETLLKELSLRGCSNTQIGSAFKKMLSGGERKRVSIGIELVTNPSLILLDEPTSGLDSFKALKIVEILQQQARKGKTIISTLHSPSSEQFGLFDRLLLMCDGNIVYQGPAKDSAQYFNSINYIVPPYTNPIDYFIRILAVRYPKTENDQKKVKFLAEKYQEHNIPMIDSGLKASLNEFQKVKEQPFVKVSQKMQYKQLIRRNFIQVRRDPRVFRAKLAIVIFIALLSLAIFWKLSGSTETDIMNMSGALYFFITFTVFTNFMPSIVQFQQERPIFLREQFSNMYGVVPYFFSKLVIDIPVLLIAPMVFTLIVYFGTGLTITGRQFFLFYLSLFLVGFCANSLGVMLSTAVSHTETALGIAPLFLMPMILLTGMLVNIETVPGWFGWLQYLSPPRYGFEILLANQFGNNTPILDRFGFEIGLWQCFVILISLTVFFRIMALIFLKALIKRFQ